MGLDQLINIHYNNGNHEEYYYRKVNWLRNWIIKNTGHDDSVNCEPINLTKENIQSLLNDCNYVLENRKEANKTLPTVNGFFFGSTDYDEYYYDDVEEVKNNMNDLLDNWNDISQVEYVDWW